MVKVTLNFAKRILIVSTLIGIALVLLGHLKNDQSKLSEDEEILAQINKDSSLVSQAEMDAFSEQEGVESEAPIPGEEKASLVSQADKSALPKVDYWPPEGTIPNEEVADEVESVEEDSTEQFLDTISISDSEEAEVSSQLEKQEAQREQLLEAADPDASESETLQDVESSSVNQKVNPYQQPGGSTNDDAQLSKRITIDQWKRQMGGQKPNILFIIADDMRPEIKANVHERSPWLESSIVTPNLDNLASQGLLFRRAYCQMAWCNPSRSSFLTSRRPETTMVHNNSVFFRENLPDVITLPQFFKNHGYTTSGIGKIFHLLNKPGDNDNNSSWSVPMTHPAEDAYMHEEGQLWKAVTKTDRKGLKLMDEMTVDGAIEALRGLTKMQKRTSKPFFLAVGLKKPHLPWYFPEQYGKLYLSQNLSMPLMRNKSSMLPIIAWFRSFEVRGHKQYINASADWGPTVPLPDWVIRELRQAYYSSVSFIDDLIGNLLQEVKTLGLDNNTIISFIGDHGYHIGEHNIVGKNTAFEVANNSPMIIRVPGVTDKGFKTDKLVEFVDLFPTLVELADLPSMPYCPSSEESKSVRLCTEGTSLVPLFDDPGTERWKNSVFYQYPHHRGYRNAFCMGYTIRTPDFRYTEWVSYNYSTSIRANWTHICGRELYDHAFDPYEKFNVAYEGLYGAIKSELSHKLRRGWREALPI